MHSINVPPLKVFLTNIQRFATPAKRALIVFQAGTNYKLDFQSEIKLLKKLFFAAQL